jgi:hypothetical protein
LLGINPRGTNLTYNQKKAKFKVALTYNLPLAGSRFGLNLAELFADENEGTDQGFFNIPLQEPDSASNNLSILTRKGRSNVLGYQEGGQPTVT